MKEFNLFGHHLEFDDNFELYNKYRVQYTKLIYETEQEISKILKDNSSVEEFIKNAITIGYTYIPMVLIITEKNLNELGIYNFDLDEFTDKYTNISEFDKCINNLLTEYISIIQTSKELEVYRDLEKLDRKRWVGGGFGVKGAIKGAVTASAMNTVTDFLYSIKDESTASSDNSEILALKRKFIEKYRDSRIFQKLIGECMDSCFSGFLNEAVYNHKIECPNINDEEAMSIYNNSVVNENDHKIKLDNSIKCISRFPYRVIFYEELYATDPRNTELDNITNFFGLSEIKLCLDYKKKYREIDLKERTFNNQTYETKEERILAEEKYIQGIKIISKDLNDTLAKNNIKLNNFDELEKYHKCLDIVEHINKKYDLDILTLLDISLLRDKEWVEKSKLSKDTKFIKELKDFICEFNHIEEDIKEYENKLNHKPYLEDEKKDTTEHLIAAIFFLVLTFSIYYFIGTGLYRNIAIIFFGLVSIANLLEFIENRREYKIRKREIKLNYYKYNKQKYREK